MSRSPYDTRFSQDAPADVQHPSSWARGWNDALAAVTDAANLALTAEGVTGANHPATSKRAGRHPGNVVRFMSQRHVALAALSNHGPQTAAELAERLGTSRNQAATRLLELRRAGMVAYRADVDDPTGYALRKTGEHAQGRVQYITDLGRAALDGAK